MKKGQILSIIILVCILTSCLSIVAAAANYGGATTIEPTSEGTCTIAPYLTISSSGKASCGCTVNIKSGYTASLQINLCKHDGNAWTPVKGWSANCTSGRSSHDKSYYVTSGESYRVYVTALVYNSSGSLVETVTANSDIVRY